MANAGKHNDTRILKQMIKEGRLLFIDVDERFMNPVHFKLKTMFNSLVINDYVSNHHSNGRKYKSHTAWKHMNRVLIKANQIRFRYWNFKPLSFQYNIFNHLTI